MRNRKGANHATKEGRATKTLPKQEVKMEAVDAPPMSVRKMEGAPHPPLLELGTGTLEVTEIPEVKNVHHPLLHLKPGGGTGQTTSLRMAMKITPRRGGWPGWPGPCSRRVSMWTFPPKSRGAVPKRRTLFSG